MISDPYKVLAVSPTATDEEIAKAYRKLAKKHHPDLNQGDDGAAKKMSEINAAYEQIKSGNTSPTGNGEGNGSYQTYGWGNNSAGQSSPFDDDAFRDFFKDFDPFSFYGNSQGQRRGYTVFDPIKNDVRAGYFNEALNGLNNITERSAEWYYYSAIANHGTGNKITALDHAKTAVQMEPDNPEYQRILNQLQDGGRIYEQQRQSYNVPTININKLCLGAWFANLYCLFCGRPC